jgi:glycosyltransferase involved in cell wall biosynthesis
MSDAPIEVLPARRPYLLFIVNVDWFFLSHRLEIARLAIKRGYRVGIATSITDRMPQLVSEGFEVHPLYFERASTGLWKTWSLFWNIFSILRRECPDIVHLVTIKPVLLGGLAARLAKVPAVVSAVSGLGFVFLAKGLRAQLMRFFVSILYRGAMSHPNAMIIFQNNDDRAIVSQSARLPSSKSTIIRGSGVDLSSYQATPLPDDGPPIVLLAARLLIDKGIREYAEAARLIIQRGGKRAQSARFALVGDIDPGNAASLTRAEVEKWHIEGPLEIWGHRKDMATTLAQSSLVVLPSYREGLPKMLIEAAACGRPVVTTDVPGCRDAIEPGVTGVLVPPRDANALATAINEMLENPQRCSEMGMNGRKLAEAYFDVAEVAERHIEIYKELLERYAQCQS